jgi:hypothetical protein
MHRGRTFADVVGGNSLSMGVDLRRKLEMKLLALCVLQGGGQGSTAMDGQGDANKQGNDGPHLWNNEGSSSVRMRGNTRRKLALEKGENSELSGDYLRITQEKVFKYFSKLRRLASVSTL